MESELNFKFTEREKKAVFDDPQIFALVINYHESQIAQGESMGYQCNYHYSRIEELKAAQKNWI
jgi:hypothetical protein